MSIIYVATQDAGVYFTDDYVSVSTQPTWTAVNNGLGALDCRHFHVDPFDPINRQYVLINTGWILYRRVNGAAWEEILTPAICEGLIGCAEGGTIRCFWLDASIPGRMWATFGSPGIAEDPAGFWVLYTDDYGDNWTAIEIYAGVWTYGFEWIVAHGDIVFFSNCRHAASGQVDYSIDGGANWLEEHLWGHYWAPFGYNILTPERIYYWSNDDGGGLHSFDYTRAPTIVFYNTLRPTSGGQMWFDPVDQLHQRCVSDMVHHFAYTTDDWVTFTASGDIGITCISPLDLNGEIVIGTNIDHSGPTPHHVVAIMVDENDWTPSGIAGSNCNVAPYTDSIPDTCGGVCQYGVQAIEIPPRDVNNYHERNHWVGSAAEMALCAPVNPGAVWFQTDTLDSYWWDGAVWQGMGGGGGALADHEHAGVPGDGGQFDADHLLSTGANDGDVLTSDGAGNSAWEPGGGGPLADHAHAGIAGDGGQLDWDLIWSDAVHDHSSAAEGGAVDASVVTYDPAVDADWDGGVDPGDTNDALDQLAERTADLEINAFVRQTIFTYAGNIAVGGGLLRIYNLTGITQVVTQVFICVTTAPTGANLIVDIHRDGVTIFTNQANRPEIVAAGFTDSTLVIDLPNWLDGEYLTAHVDAIGTTLTGANLTIHVVHHS